MRRVIGVVIAAIAYTVILPLAAFAQEGGSSLGGPEGPIVGGTGGSVGGTGGTIGGTGGTVFTGAEIAGIVVLALGLLAIGGAILVLSRRRSTSRIAA
ncbi:MAG: LPXTG cell wall anchor domain-containing protein [Actinomycetota bacterium]